MLASRMARARASARTAALPPARERAARARGVLPRALDWTLAHRRPTLGIALASFAVAIVFASRLSTEFFPPSDEGIFLVRIEAPPGTVLEVDARVPEARRSVDPEAARGGGAVLGGGPGQRAEHAGASERGHDVRHAQAARRAQAQRAGADGRGPRGARAHGGPRDPHLQPGLDDARRRRLAQGQFEVELRGNLSLQDLDRVSDEFIGGLGGARRLRRPEQVAQARAARAARDPGPREAAALGIDARSLATTVQLMIGGLDVGVFKEAGHRYDIRMRLEEKDRNDPDAINRLYVRTRSGDVVELSNLVAVEQGAAPSAITRSERQRSVTVAANLDGGLVLGDAIEAARGIARRVLPEGVTLSLSGQAEAMQEGVSQAGVALVLGLLVIYMVLAAQFESLVHPLTVMLAVPLAMTGALGGLYVFGQTLNLFSLIGILLLFGLVTKNSILLVDYANQLRAEGMDKVEAMRRAAPVRMRPVVMTAVAMIFGVLPAAIGIGPGAETRRRWRSPPARACSRRRCSRCSSCRSSTSPSTTRWSG